MPILMPRRSFTLARRSVVMNKTHRSDAWGYAVDEQDWISERARDLMDSGMNWLSARNQAAREWCNGGRHEE